MPVLKPEAILATGYDERFPVSNVVDGNDSTFYVSTGMYPQEILLSFGNDEVSISRIQLTCHGVKGLRIERCVERVPTLFEPVVECELANPAAGLQREQFQLNKATLGTGIHFIKLVLVSGYEQFAAVHNVAFEGDIASKLGAVA
jgi:heat shock protein beta-11